MAANRKRDNGRVSEDRVIDNVRVRDVSEFELIRRLMMALPLRARESHRILLSIGDDAAVASISPAEMLVVTTDTLTEGVHFRLDWTSWENLGHKAIAVNLSDIAGMGATPLLLTVSLALTGDELVRDLESMYRGMGKVAMSNHAVIAGGDVTRTPGPLSVSVTAIGETRRKQLMRRDGAQPNDLIWVTGTIGAAAAGLELELMPDEDMRKRASTANALTNALHCPTPRCSAGQTLAAIGVRCGMDVSDGLAGDLQKILVASDVDAELSLADLPIAASVRALFRDRELDLALHGGDDYELLFTAPPSFSSQIRDGFELIGVRTTIIGQIHRRSGAHPRIVGMSPHGVRRTIAPSGFDHFGSG
jgi:thiamine-monophosphate kinase